MRAFLGIPFPGELRVRLAEVGRSIDGLRAQKPATIHLTIRFLGEIRDPEQVTRALEPVVAAHPPFDVEVRGLGAFPNRRRATVVWARVGDGQMEAGALAAGVENALVPLGFSRERRAFRAHVTLGRFKSPRGLGHDILDPDRDFGRVRAESLVLYASTLTPQGAVHRAVEEMSLAGGM